jgi:predicted nucleotide-binding protein
MTELVEIISGLLEYISDSVEQGDFGIGVMTTDEKYPAMYQDKAIAQGRQREIIARYG